MKFYRNRRGGNNTVEFGPALFIIIIVVLLPSLDILQIGLAYACGWYCNHLATRETACTGPVPAGAALTAANKVTAAFMGMGIGQFLRVSAGPTNVCTLPVPPDVDGDGINDYCQCVTTMTVSPMFPVPFMASKGVTFTYYGDRPLEEKGLN